MNTRTCPQCKTEKPESKFYNAKWDVCAKCDQLNRRGPPRHCVGCMHTLPGKDFYVGHEKCILCEKNGGSVNRDAHKEAKRQDMCRRSKEWIERDHAGYTKWRMIQGAKQRAKKANIPFTLTEDDIAIPEYCPVFGMKLEINRGGNGHKANSPSLDKIIPSLGYVKGNVIVVSMRANGLKSDASVEELTRLVEFYKGLM